MFANLKLQKINTFSLQGYTVLQYRHDGTVSFYESWNNYKNGFGNLKKAKYKISN